jgi:hypothetical protein
VEGEHAKGFERSYLVHSIMSLGVPANEALAQYGRAYSLVALQLGQVTCIFCKLSIMYIEIPNSCQDLGFHKHAP